MIVEGIFDLLGWDLKKDEEGKEPEFGGDFTALGVQVVMPEDDVAESMKVKDKEARLLKLKLLMTRAREEGYMNLALATSARGLVQYSRFQCFGKCGGPALHFLSTVVRQGGLPWSPKADAALGFWEEYFSRSMPRTLVFSDRRRPVVVCSDGAEEESGVTYAAIIIDPERGSGGKQYFAGRAPSELVEHWRKRSGVRKVIHQAELLPVALAAVAWRSWWAGRRVIVAVDNDAARAALVSGSSSSLASADIAHEFWVEVSALACFPWITRVPSGANPSDPPSRWEFEWIEGLVFKKIEACLPARRLRLGGAEGLARGL